MTTAAVMAVTSFAGCSSNNANSGNVGGSTNVAEGEKTIVIGGSGPLTGDAAQYGVGVKNAIQLAVNEVNAAGGVNGNKLKLVFEDDEADSGDKAVNAYNTLKDQGMQILLGTVTTGSCLAVVDKSKQDNIFQFTPSASAQDVIANDNCFQICFTDPNQGKASADYIADNKVATKIGVIYDSSDAYSSGIYNAFKTEAAAKGLELVSEQSFTKDSKTDFSAQIADCKNKGAELVFLPIYYQQASLILTQSKNAGFAPKFFGCDGLDGLTSIKNFDTSLAEGVMLLTPFAADSKDQATQDFVKAYKAAFVAVVAGVTALIRFLPFVVFGGGRPTPKFVVYLAGVLPCAIMAMLVVYCLRGVDLLGPTHGLPELLAGAAVVGLHLWKKNTLLSIAVGTALYMVLVQAVFV